LDRTGLAGHFDLNLAFRPIDGASPLDAPIYGGMENSRLKNAGESTFAGALKRQLGLQLTKETGPVTVYVIDHIEMPSAN
jgi:uncharacterized protein (TIGR03435 family)